MSSSILKTSIAVVAVTAISATAVMAASSARSAGPVYPYCYSSGGNCAYPDGSYWTNCSSALPRGPVSTLIAMQACQDFVAK